MNTKFQKVGLVLMSLGLLNACGGKGETSGSAGVTQSSIIIGDLDWSEVDTLTPGGVEAVNALAVGHVDLPVMGSRCTGFLISDNVLMTNQHCIPSEAYARGVSVSFEVVAGVAKGEEKRFDCSKFIGNNQELDFALLECEGNPGQEYGHVNLAESAAEQGEPVYVVQQNCDYYSNQSCYFTKKVSFGDITEVSGNSFTHNADTLGGSSGSPIFSSDTHEVVAIHHAGLGNNGQGRGIENYGVSMAQIVEHIKDNFPQVGLGSDSGSDQGGDQPGGDQGGSQPSNDSPAGAKAMRFGVGYNGSIGSSEDLDYYKFTLSSTQSISLTLDIRGSADLDLYIVTESGQVLARSEGTTSFEQIRGTARAGTYYVLVKGYNGAQGQYQLKVK